MSIVNCNSESEDAKSVAGRVGAAAGESRRTAVDELRGFLVRATQNGLFPLMAYSVMGDNAATSDDGELPDAEDEAASVKETGATARRVILLTTNILDLSYALSVLDHFGSGYNLGRRMRETELLHLCEENPHVFRKHEAEITGLGAHNYRFISAVVARFGAPFMKEKGFALVDICGFSRLPYSQQLSSLYSLTNMLDSAIARSKAFCDRLNMRTRYGRNSTGDGYYFWHEGVGGGSDVVAFITLACVLQHAVELRGRGFPMQLRASFYVGPSFLFYDANARWRPDAPASNAIGPATNGAARLITASHPGQILMNCFDRSGQGTERMNPASLIAQANELFREEGAGAATIRTDPGQFLRIVDKHGDVWHAYNIVGEVPSRDGRTEIGLYPDEARPIEGIPFRPAAQTRMI